LRKEIRKQKRGVGKRKEENTGEGNVLMWRDRKEGGNRTIIQTRGRKAKAETFGK
jgi:hypothetical protein